MRILGIDYGEARTGLAISEGTLATAKETLRERDPQKLSRQVAAICRAEKIETIVLGLPKNMDGTEGFRAEATRRFSALLQEQLPDVDIEFYDERLTTVAASQLMIEAGTKSKKKKGIIDALSAQLILQDYLDYKK